MAILRKIIWGTKNASSMASLQNPHLEHLFFRVKGPKSIDTAYSYHIPIAWLCRMSYTLKLFYKVMVWAIVKEIPAFT